jgi:hypothetical protein
MSWRGRLSRLMDRIADDDAWSMTFVSVLVFAVVVLAIWIATGIFWPDR